MSHDPASDAGRHCAPHRHDPDAGPGRHRKPRPPAPPWTPRDYTCVCGQHPDPDEGGPSIPSCLPPLPPPKPAPISPERPPARHRRPREDDPVPEGVVSLYEARNRKRYREFMREQFGEGRSG
ncbi:hypothetical protein [Kitasatospora sp. NBC_01302]|uniref:hypothetical protein n=1 Tax=Kitasatospora sp. NBC_01302 TaxID=2903575 RepID=UPI002E0D4242|nr:hypothetical protein OG294_40785 [Kitasatospora sp. NBC_01302]